MDPTLRYIDRRLRFEYREGEVYNLCVTYELIGCETNELIATQLVNLSNSLCDQIARHTASIRALNPTELADLGWLMSTVAFADSVRHAFLRDYEEARETDRRVRVHIEDYESVVSGWPWEFLWLEEIGFIAVHPSTSIVRACRSVNSGALPSTVAPGDKMDVLIVWADPGDPYPLLDAGLQISTIVRILRNLRSSVLNVRMLTPRRRAAEPSKVATLSNIRSALGKKESQIICFFAHAEFDEENNEGVIVLENDDPGRLYQWVGASELLETFSTYTNVYVLLFDGCESASRGPRGNGLSIAEAVATRGRYVIGMQYVWPAAACHPFWREFFATISVPQPIDDCVFTARDYLYRLINFLPGVTGDDLETFAQSSNSGISSIGDWGYPVLYRPALVQTKKSNSETHPISGATWRHGVRNLVNLIGSCALESLLKINNRLLEALLKLPDDKGRPDISHFIGSTRDDDFLRVLLAGEDEDIRESIVETTPVWFTHLLTPPAELTWTCKDIPDAYLIRMWTVDHGVVYTRETKESGVILSREERRSIPSNNYVRWEVKAVGLPSFDPSIVRGIFRVLPPGRATLINLYLSGLQENLIGLQRELRIAECCLEDCLYDRLKTRLHALEGTMDSAVERFALRRMLASIYTSMHDKLSQHLLADPEGVWAAELANQFVDAGYNALIQD